MKALVMELKEDKAAVLTDKGTFEIVDNKGYQIGQRIEVAAGSFLSNVTKEDIEIELELRKQAEIDTGRKETVSSHEDISMPYHNNDKYSKSMRGRKTIKAFSKASGVLRRIAAAAAIVIIIGGGVASYAAPVSTISVDVNPSLEIKLNVFDRVVSVKAYDEDDRNIAETINRSAKGKKLYEALQIALSNFRDNEYITEEDTCVVTSVYTHFGKDEELKEKLETSAAEWNTEQENNKLSGKVALENVDVDESIRIDANKKNVSPGKLYKATEVEKAYEEAGEDTDEDWLNKPVNEINKAIDGIKEQSGKKSKDEPAGLNDNSGSYDSNKSKEKNSSTNIKPEITSDNSKDNNGIDNNVIDDNGTVHDNEPDNEMQNIDLNGRESNKPENNGRDDENTQMPNGGNDMENGNPPGNGMKQDRGMMP